MDLYEARPQVRAGTPAAAERVTAFLRGVYGWMGAGLGVTAVVAVGVAGSPAIVGALVRSPLVLLALIGGELALVFYLSARVARLAPATAAGLFLLYSALNGVTLSLVLLAYTGESVANTFVVCAVMFGALAAYGSTTRRSLAGLGQFAFMGLIGLLVAMVVGIFWHNDALQFVIACAGVVVFTCLTAWDAQRLRTMALSLPDGQVGAYTVVGALSLYLDFVNLFLFLLRFLGGRRE
ncbi:MAG TPA: Bax inhibitor-1/YccA family protein [Candidatus Limnocylindria bacterium]|nr:Bax inhibitor-1/YccA family protein [Candidatus Limnocylindria bacterium]